ncbi:MAG: DUF362 domain-containing protein [Candidatus Omnitrophica bacterium]|nr:DUF362 domain-containing protein [Candidatus Omnitrophota bacterium]
MNSKVSIAKCSDYTPALVQEATRKAIDALGGISNFIKAQSRVLVKPNLLMAKEPEFGVDTHPEVLRAVIKLLKEIGCKILVGDGPSVWGNQVGNVGEVYRRSGTERVCQEEGVTLVRFEKRRWRKKFPLTTVLDECDYLISIPKFKTHDLTILTAAIKNLFGLIPGTYKTELHKKYSDPNDFANMLVDIYEEAPPTLSIVDGIVAMEGDGPATGGRLRNAGLLLASVDAVALDSVLALIMGINPRDILTTKAAASRGLGEADINSITILGEKLEEVIERPFKLPSGSIYQRIPRPIIELAKKLIRFYPKVYHRNCILCEACLKACPPRMISIKSKRIVIDYSGCISCFCCQEACPSNAIRIKKSVMAKLVGL